MTQLWDIIGLLRPYWRAIGQSLAAGVLVSLLGLPGPYITKLLIDDVYPHGDYGLLHFVLLGGAAAALFLAAVQALSGCFGQRLGIQMGLEYQSRFYQHVQGMDFGFFDRRETGEILSRFDDMHQSMAQVIGIINTLVLNLLQLLVFPAVLFWISWRLALVSIAVLPLDTVLACVSRRLFGRISATIAREGAAISARAYESLASIRTVQALGIEARLFDRLRAMLVGLARLQLRASLLGNGSAFAGSMLRSIGSLAYGWYGWTQVLDGQLTIGTFMAFSGYVGFLYGPIENLIGLLPRIEVTLVHAGRFLEIYRMQPAVRERPGAARLGSVGGAIQFDAVSFAYGDRRVLDGVTLTIPARRCVALVGRSGAGKSTLAKLVPRFYDPCQGCVTLDGRDVRDYQLASLRSRIGFAMQGSRLFQGTIYENLTFGRDVPWQDVEAAARAAHVHEFVSALPDGYQTLVGEEGSGLSEGQKQRLALARVLLLDAPILILDEPTASLDAVSEQHVRDALAQVRIGRTTIVIAHRPATIETADEVVVVEAGRIAARGLEPGDWVSASADPGAAGLAATLELGAGGDRCVRLGVGS